MRTRAQDAGEALDSAYLARFLGYDVPDLEALTISPTPELVLSLLYNVAQKAAEFDSLNTDKLKVDVEYNNATHGAEKKAAVQRATIARQNKEIETLRQQLAESTTKQEGLESQLGATKGAASDSNSEVGTLRARVESLEASKRESLALLDAKTTEKDRLHEELNEQQGRLVALRKDVSELEQRNQSLDNLTSQQKFKESSLKQEVDLLRKTNEWQQTELSTTSQEHTKFRKERNLAVGKLQRDLEDATASVEALRASETALRQRLSELDTRLNDTFEKHAEAQADHVRSEQSLREQIESSKRLAELQAQSANMHKAQVQSLQSQADELREEAAQEIGRLQADVDTERAEKEGVERRLAELEVQLENMERQPRMSAPSTPVPNGSPRGLDLKGSRAVTNTQLYAQYVEAKNNLVREERRCAKLQSALDELIQDMESKAPELIEVRQEQERLEAEVLSFSRMLDDANAIRDNAVREANKWQSDSAALTQQSELLRQQLRDVSAQVKILLVELQSKEQGIGEMTVQERLELKRMARGELTQPAIEHISSTQSLISERLVIFRSVVELQEQNEKLLRLTRELGEQMEGEEAQQKARQSAAQVSEANELRAQVERYKDELQATAIQIDSYMKERDMFRRMLQHRGTIGPQTDVQAMFGSSIPPATPLRNGEFGTPGAKELDELNKLLKDQQAFFDQFRQESANDRVLLKSQIDDLTRERSSIQAEAGRLDAQLALSTQRYELLQSNYGSLRAENGALQQRLQSLVETAAKQDLRSQQLVEDLVEARSLAETLRNESATTKAEKELWKRIESRLTEDNQSLLDERSRLSKLVTDLQSLANERELNENEARRRLQARSVQLETELADFKRKMEVEVDESKKSSARKEYEESQSRTRIDDLVKSLSSTREELVAARTARDQLQTRVDEMRIDLRAAQDKLITLQQPRAGPLTTNGTLSEQANGETGLTPEQHLTLQMTDIRHDLDRANNELNSAREQIEQYKTIAQTTEEELLSFNQTSDQYREEADKLLAEKDLEITKLKDRIQDLSTELATTNAELSDLRTKHDEISRSGDQERLAAEAELTRLRKDHDRFAQEKSLYQEDLKAQAGIAQQAQESYENELLKHADAARQLQSARQERDTLRVEVIDARKDVQVVTNKLVTGEESWSEQRESLDSEIAELKQRRSDGEHQLKLLHQQLESFSSELQALRQGRIEQTDADLASGDAGSRLQEVITFLRREKEIVEVQYELSNNDKKRLQQQLGQAQSQLDDIQVKLAEERSRNNDRAVNEASTARLAQAIDELNLFRESAVTLRNEARQAKEKLMAKDQEYTQVLAELQPLRAKLGVLEANLESKDEEIRLITSDRDHWRDRTQSIISKYDRVDPAELEQLRMRIKELEELLASSASEIATLQTNADVLRAQVSTQDQLLDEKNVLEQSNQQLGEQIEAVKKAADERMAKFKDQAKEQNRIQKARITEGKAELDAAQAEVTRLAAEVEQLKQERIQATDTAPTPQAGGEDTAPEVAKAHADFAEQVTKGQEMQSRITELESQLATLSTELEELRASGMQTQEQGEIVEKDDHSEELAALQQRLAETQAEVSKLQGQLADAETAKPQVVPPSEDGQLPDLTDEQASQIAKNHPKVKLMVLNTVKARVSKEVDKLNQEIAKKDEQIVKLKESAAPAADGKGATMVSSSTQSAVDDQEKQELLQKLSDAQKDKDAAIKQAVDKEQMKVKVQLSQRDMAQAKLGVVQKAAQDTPQRPVIEVWEEAKVAKAVKPGPKPPAANANIKADDTAATTPTDTKPASGIPQPSASRIDLPRGPGGISVRGRGGATGVAGTKRTFDGATANNNKRTKG